MSSKVNYKNIYDILRREITDEVYPSGSFLPTESVLAEKYSVSRPTIAKAYNQLQEDGFIKKRKGAGTEVIFRGSDKMQTFGLLLPGAGESEIFSIINDQLLEQSRNGKFNCLWEGATASSADIRKAHIENSYNNYIENQVDGIFFSPLERVPDADQLNLEICERITQANIPIVLIDRDIVEFPARSKYDLVGIDNFSAGYVMGKHLIEAGCTTVYFFLRPDSAYSLRLRMAGLKASVQENYLHFDDSHVFCGEPDDLEFVGRMKIIPGKTGIVCGNDSTAAVLMSSLDITGVKIMSDVLICGYDDMKYDEHLKFSLTSFRQPCKEIANISIELMMRRIKNPDVIPVTAQVYGELIYRDSTRFSV